MLDLAEGVAEIFLDAQAITIDNVRYRWLDLVEKERLDQNEASARHYRANRAAINARRKASPVYKATKAAWEKANRAKRNAVRRKGYRREAT